MAGQKFYSKDISLTPIYLFLGTIKAKHLLQLLCLSMIVSCSAPSEKAQKQLLQVDSSAKKNVEPIVLVSAKNLNIDSINKPNNPTEISEEKRKTNNSTEKDVRLGEKTQEVNESNYILPGYKSSTFTKKGASLEFIRKVKDEEDQRKGCGGASSNLSFTIDNAVDSFLIENEMLKTINFNYKIDGGNTGAYGEHPYKGKIKGILLPNHTWQIEMNVKIKMKDMVLDNMIEKQVIFKDNFK